MKAEYLCLMYELLARRAMQESTQEIELEFAAKLDELWEKLTVAEQIEIEDELNP